MSDPTDLDPPDAVGEPPASAAKPETGSDPRREHAKTLFELGQSLRVIGAQIGVSEAAIRKWAKEGGWVKGAPAPVAPKPAPPVAKVTAIRPGIEVGSPQVRVGTQSGVCEPPEDANCEPGANQGHDQPLYQRFQERVRHLLENPERDEAADVAARAVVQVVREHRHSITKAQMLADRLLGQLDMASDMREELEEFITSITEPGKYRSMLMKMVSLATHAGTLKDLATAQVKLVTLERQAFGLAPLQDPTPPPMVEEAKQPEPDVFDQMRERVRLRLASGGAAT